MYMENSPFAPDSIAGLRVMTTIVQLYEPWARNAYSREFYVLENGSLISVSAKIGKNVKIGFGCFVDECCELQDGVVLDYHVSLADQVVIGVGTVLEEVVTVSHECRIGSQCRIGSRAHIGAMNHLKDGTQLPAHVVVLEESVEDTDDIGSNELGCYAVVDSKKRVRVAQPPRP